MSKSVTKTTSMNIRLDNETRRKLQLFADQMGVPATTLAAANIKQMLRSGEVRLTAELTPTPHLKKLIREAEADYAANKNIITISDEVELKSFFDSL